MIRNGDNADGGGRDERTDNAHDPRLGDHPPHVLGRLVEKRSLRNRIVQRPVGELETADHRVLFDGKPDRLLERWGCVIKAGDGQVAADQDVARRGHHSVS